MGIFRIATIVGRLRWRFLIYAFLLILGAMLIALAIGKTYQRWDNDPERGALAISQDRFGEPYSTPIYLDQGWSPTDSLWFYNTTQGSALLPYDFFIALEQAGTQTLFRANTNMDGYRYLPQKPTFFNRDGLPVGFVKDTYQGVDYLGFTCAACHTSQINYNGKAIRIDGGPSMADMVGFLSGLEQSLQATLDNDEKYQRFVTAVLARNNTYKTPSQIRADLETWTASLNLYNRINHSPFDYGYARLDAFGRIYNRVLQYMINRQQLEAVLLGATNDQRQYLLTPDEVSRVLDGISETIISDRQFVQVITRLGSTAAGYPGLSRADITRIKQHIFNEANAPVSYGYLWDVPHSDYVQWNGLAANAGVGPLGRNAGEVMGVFAILDWSAQKPGFSLSAWLTGQQKKTRHIDFTSSIDSVNLARLEAHLKSLTSPRWPTLATSHENQQNAKAIFDAEPAWKIDPEKVRRGQWLYATHCQSCHELIDRTDWDRKIVAHLSNVNQVGTDPATALNSVNYTGYSGNFNNTYLRGGIGSQVIQNRAPALQILTAATTGVVATPDPDKWLVHRFLDWLYMLAHSFFNNELKPSIKTGDYQPDTTADPYASLRAYKARPLNGIWATAPYLHNGSVPTLYDLLLPKQRTGDPEEGVYRRDEFRVGAREFDPLRVGFRSEGYDGFLLRTTRPGDLNSGHEYGTIHDLRVKAGELEPLSDEDRWALVEYLKTL
ncbi:di-heme-cytochrome C peroxidase [Cellvibrio japonicus]|uniref:Cytochrome c domain-containing protein n=1 Tax=Cellvibrio japonicus (strain Ueda107) TaxID=498211 RepID=B3PGW8_CELJU|nr:di-heme-cytochrome C peroxidase [Cellvibrio japonicus]ACE84247.1 hypothetical protein CJA_3563 [Cellvibrio japonicus Ueda107]QEI13773.1 ribonuclease E [Cellvibrio japonicus]QEI17347.1 ribonuclease E [Cellvibrio japonicus]QEI20923.1 ribonuclease E [Cellvibrio japonicus]